MSSTPRNLHGDAANRSETALLLIDVINDLEFPEGDQLLEFALPMADRLLTLKRRAVAAGVPVIYVNDNFGRWRSDFSAQVDHCLHDGVCGRPIAARLKPEADDYFVLKPKHSGFFATALELLLRHLGAKRLVITGLAGNNCVLHTAGDGYLHDFAIVVPADCIASNTKELNDAALELMRVTLKADVRRSTEIELVDRGE
jgi:nicotinamidase-related amidase